MSLIRLAGVILLVIILNACQLRNANAADENAESWLRGSGADLELRLQGEVVDADGRPAADIRVTGEMNEGSSHPPLRATIKANRFEIWVPVNQHRLSSLWIGAASSNGQLVAYATLNNYELRQTAIDGLKLTLQPPSRHVSVKVVDSGQAIGGAIVKAELAFGVELRAQTDTNGIAEFGLLPHQALTHLMAWTDDNRIGGYDFGRAPSRDPESNEQLIELNKCREQKLRFINEDGAAVPGVNFTLLVATASPNYNFVGTNEHSRMTTDKNGEAIPGWFPDWDRPFFYAELQSNAWIMDDGPKDADGVKVFRVKKGKTRKRVEGRVTSPETHVGGFLVTLESFQGEQAHRSDNVSAFTNPDGSFAVDVLPDATYCANALDKSWVGNIVAVVPYQSESNKVTSPELTVIKGQEMEVNVTSGPERAPYSNLAVAFQRNFDFNWREAGETRSGTAGPRWWATTDDSGRAITRTLPGKMQISVYAPRWQTEKSVNVLDDQPAKFDLHRDLDEKRTFAGRLILVPGAVASLNDAEVSIGSLDASYQDRQELRCNEDGTFSFDTRAASVGIFARTHDGKAAGSLVVEDSKAPVEIRMQATVNCDGQLLQEGDRPAAGVAIHAYVRFKGKTIGKSRHPVIFDAQRIESLTDGQGNYTLRRVPCAMKVLVLANGAADDGDATIIDHILLKPNESPSRAVNHLTSTRRDTRSIPLAEKCQTALRDAVLSDSRVLLIISDADPNALEFIDRHYLDSDTNKDAYPFVQVVVSGGSSAPLDAADIAFLKKNGWLTPTPNHILAYVLDGNREKLELGHQDISPRSGEAVAAAATFLHQYAPTPVDAAEKWNAAFAEAKRTNRRVWARVTGRNCGPCWQFTRWLGDQQAALDKDYVFLKIDESYDKNSAETVKQLTRGENFGIPYHVIFDADEIALIDSVGPSGNLGGMHSDEGKKQLRKMLLETRRNLTDAEVDQLVESIKH